MNMKEFKIPYYIIDVIDSALYTMKKKIDQGIDEGILREDYDVSSDSSPILLSNFVSYEKYNELSRLQNDYSEMLSFKRDLIFLSRNGIPNFQDSDEDENYLLSASIKKLEEFTKTQIIDTDYYNDFIKQKPDIAEYIHIGLIKEEDTTCLVLREINDKYQIAYLSETLEGSKMLKITIIPKKEVKIVSEIVAPSNGRMSIKSMISFLQELETE